MLPTSLYIHIPWCIRKCPYCDFNSHVASKNINEQQYVAALLKDFAQDLATFHVSKIDNIFIGGGTPSLFSSQSLHFLLTQLANLVTFKPNIEITLEANPGTVEYNRFTSYYQIGINRLSIGIQSFNSQHLKVLGRIHDGQQAHRAIIAAQKAGFKNINLDLMYGLPQQTVAEGLQDLNTALSYDVPHISWYQLTIEPNTIFYKQRPNLPVEDTIYQLENRGVNKLNANGYRRYEISAFSKPTFTAQHNLNYWLFGDYYGIGAGAHGKITAKDKIYRTQKYRQPGDYLNTQKNFTAVKKIINPTSLIFEFMLNVTRLQYPIPNKLFVERTGLPYRYLQPLLQKAAQQKLIDIHGSAWQVTEFGRRYNNDLQIIFLNTSVEAETI